MKLNTREVLLILYGAGFAVSLMHYQNRALYATSIHDAIFRSFVWPFILLYFVAQFAGWVTCSALYGLWDMITSPTISLSREVSNKNVSGCGNCDYPDACHGGDGYRYCRNPEKLIEHR